MTGRCRPAVGVQPPVRLHPVRPGKEVAPRPHVLGGEDVEQGVPADAGLALADAQYHVMVVVTLHFVDRAQHNPLRAGERP